MQYEYKTTFGALRWDERATVVEDADDPVSPPGENWRLVGTSLGALKFSTQPIVWSWERKID